MLSSGLPTTSWLQSSSSPSSAYELRDVTAVPKPGAPVTVVVNGSPSLLSRTCTAPLRPDPPGTPTATSGVPSRSKSELLTRHSGSAEAGGAVHSRLVAANPTAAVITRFVCLTLRMAGLP